MNIHEYQAKQLFQAYGIPSPQSKQVTTAAAAVLATNEIAGNAWVVKAQVHAGGRGKVGGVKVAQNTDEVKQFATEMIGSRLVTKQTGEEGLPIESVLIEATSAIKREFYLSVLVDRGSERVMFVSSIAGGMDIEAVAKDSPEKIISILIDPSAGVQSYQCRQVAFSWSLQGTQVRALEKVMKGMYQLLLEKDASQIEINPLIETEEGDIIALDAKINFDDNAVALHPDILQLRDEGQEDEKENKAQLYDLNYITLDGSIGCMVNGAGLAMATMDLVKLKGGAPANFLDVGGGTNTEKVCEAFKLILSDSNVKAVLVNIFGGIVHCDIIAKGILTAVDEVHVTIPVVVRLEGTNAEKGRELLNNSDFGIVAADNLASAAEQVVTLAKVVA
ncbi:MAG: ADP-forming succinate--CoA ligase subunit beta [Methylococcales symbiont of Iophon sp. n. MRB-2018]|nr:MAG: ADP-forming succinate--CoA ligase subunit beta [Methylococcales symbiont of Iophon sp. n. MRB-2018]KAF3979327.1 MAG: ADP-forming succinate--CoA ligase subunit beta [Methylococcales symbiont of Iophon sp. n. MRB-2018]